jgi:nucleotide-binding universal stress UspA family protein
MYDKIVVPLDGSPLAEGVLEHVRALASCMGSQILLLHVLGYPHYDYLITDASMAASLRSAMEADACDYLHNVAAQLQTAGLKVTAEVISVSGPVADAIIDYAREKHAELIAMSTHGRTGPARWFLGSIADRVVRGAHMPVLMVRPVAH